MLILPLFTIFYVNKCSVQVHWISIQGKKTTDTLVNPILSDLAILEFFVNNQQHKNDIFWQGFSPLS